MDVERYRQAWSRNGISRQQFEDQEKVVLQDQGTVNYDKSAVQYAEVQLNYCHIVAPITGRVGITTGGPGSLQ
jgi:multidrug efflux system membrane fusion protein